MKIYGIIHLLALNSSTTNSNIPNIKCLVRSANRYSRIDHIAIQWTYIIFATDLLPSRCVERVETSAIARMPWIFRVESLMLRTQHRHTQRRSAYLFSLENVCIVWQTDEHKFETITFFEKNMQNPWIFNGIVWLFFFALFAVFIVYLHRICMRLLCPVSFLLSSRPFPSNGCRMWCINGNTYVFIHIVSGSKHFPRATRTKPSSSISYIFSSSFQSQAFYDDIRLKSHFRMLQADESVMW